MTFTSIGCAQIILTCSHSSCVSCSHVSCVHMFHTHGPFGVTLNFNTFAIVIRNMVKPKFAKVQDTRPRTT